MTILSQLANDEPAVQLPPTSPQLRPLLLASRAPLILWRSSQVDRLALARCPAHLLVRLHAVDDPSPVVDACAAYRHAPGPGGKATYPLEVLVRAEIVRLWAASCSHPALEQLLACDLIARWFVGLPLLGPTPDHATLNRFHAWLTDQHPDALFRDVLAFLDQVDPEDPATTPQIVDTFAMASPVAPTSSPAHLLLQLSARLVTTWMQQAPAAAQGALPPLDLGPLCHPPDTRTVVQRQAQPEQAVTVTRWLVAACTPHLPQHDAIRTARLQPGGSPLGTAAGDGRRPCRGATHVLARSAHHAPRH